MRAARFLNLQDAETRNANSFALLEMLGDQAHEIAEEGFTRRASSIDAPRPRPLQGA